MNSINWDDVLNDVFNEIQERKKEAVKFAFSLQGEIAKLGPLLKYGQVITVETIDRSVETGAGFIIYPRELYFEPPDAPRDRFMSIISDVGKKWAFENYRNSIETLKERLMSELGILDPNNIPDQILSELKEELFRNYSESMLGRSQVFFEKDGDELIPIRGMQANFTGILPGDLLLRVSSDGFRGRAIYISTEQIKNINIENLLDQLRDLIAKCNDDIARELSD